MLEFLAFLLLGFAVDASGVLPGDAQAKVDAAQEKVVAEYKKADSWFEENAQPLDYSKLND